MTTKPRVLITGGAGYIGSVLVPELVQQGYPVTVLDTFWFWNSPQEYQKALGLEGVETLRLISGDIRSPEKVWESLADCHSVIHLACISNDPSSELDPAFTHNVNYVGSTTVIDLAKKKGISRFIYASSSSVYGIKKEPNVTEDLALEPLTQYSKLKVEIERYLLGRLSDNFKGVILRPSTVCGYSPRQRLDVVVNILTNLAINKGRIKVLGGTQLRPNIHIKDMARAYELLLEAPLEKINGKIYNAGDENLTVMQIAELVRAVIGKVAIETQETNDPRSYHVNSDKIKQEVGFTLHHSVEESIRDMKEAFAQGKIPNPDDERYVNMKRMKTILQKLEEKHE